jgi:hypothetical protein
MWRRLNFICRTKHPGASAEEEWCRLQRRLLVTRQAFSFKFRPCPAAGCPSSKWRTTAPPVSIWTSSPKETGPRALAGERRRLHLRPGVHGRYVGAPVLAGAACPHVHCPHVACIALTWWVGDPWGHDKAFIRTIMISWRKMRCRHRDSSEVMIAPYSFSPRSQTEKYCSLICHERKIRYHDW